MKHEYEKGWIGVDFDGTLAKYEGWRGALVFGEPIPAMVERVKQWLKDGERVKIITARAEPQDDIPLGVSLDQIKEAIADWCEWNIGQRLEVVSAKDYAMTQMWDDRVVQVELNTGRVVTEVLQREIDNQNHMLETYRPKYTKPRERACCHCECCRSWMDDDTGEDCWWLDCKTGKSEHVDRPDWRDTGCKEWICDHCGGNRETCPCLEDLSENDSLRVHLHRKLEQIEKMRNCHNCNGTYQCKYKARGECQDTTPSQVETYLIHWEMK